jgi:hypothetical protein
MRFNEAQAPRYFAVNNGRIHDVFAVLLGIENRRFSKIIFNDSIVVKFNVEKICLRRRRGRFLPRADEGVTTAEYFEGRQWIISSLRGRELTFFTADTPTGRAKK